MMDNVDEKIYEQNQLLQRSLFTVIQLARGQAEPGIDQALGNLQKALRSDNVFPLLQEGMEGLKMAILSLKTAPPPASNREDCSDESLSDCVEGLQNSYLEILGTLEVDLGDAYLDQLKKLRKRVARNSTLATLLSCRDEIVEIARNYAQQVFENRNQAASFIAEVADRLSELEKYFVASMENIRKDCQINSNFNNRLESEINQTTENISRADDLEQLKSMVMSKLQVIGEAIKQKTRYDRKRMNVATHELGDIKQQFATIQDEVSRVQKENRALLYKLRLDPLTGAYNRLAYEEYLANELSRYKRYNRKFTLILLDIDNFKLVNDNHGHIVGDRCLQETVNNIKMILRQNDMIARFGGDEFVVILPETSREEGARVAEKLRQSIEFTEFMAKGRHIPVTITMGVTEVKDDDNGIEPIFTRADYALLQAKQAGRNRVEVV